MITQLIIPVVVLGLMGLIFGGGLAVASKVFEVKTDERVPLVREKLPGANCGGCGYPGCDAMAEAIVNGEAPVNGCPVGGAACASAIAEIMGLDAGDAMPMVASVGCKGSCDLAPNRAEYYGIHDCREALIANGGAKQCRFGCLGYGTCVDACVFDAIHIGDKGLPEVDVDACTACGKCRDACPRSIISLIPKDQLIHVDCRSHDKGKLVRANCGTGCIGCKACVKVCEAAAITVDNNLAAIDYTRCVQCGACAEKCPTGAITWEKDRVVTQPLPPAGDDGPKQEDMPEVPETAPVIDETEEKIEIKITEL